MHAGVKLIIGILVLIAGFYWYLADVVANPATTWLGMSALHALKTIFIGIFGLLLIVIGLLIVWIEYEDLKWESQEKSSRRKR